MKVSIILFLFLSFCSDSTPFEKFIRIIPSDWRYEKNDKLITITKKDSIEIQYCDVNPIRFEPIRKVPYIITIEAMRKLSNQEIKKRKLLQDSLLAVYQKNYDLKSDRINFGELESFKYNKNYIDSLKIPFYTNNEYSYFLKNNYPWGHCFLSDSIRIEIGNFEKKSTI
jgi:hypothetical protein